MSLTKYIQYGRFVGYRISIRRENKIVEQLYFPFSKYDTAKKCYNAAKKKELEMQKKWHISDMDRLIRKDGTIYGLKLYLDKHGYPEMKIQAVYKKKKLHKAFNLNKWEWESTFEYCITMLLPHYKIALTQEIAMAIENAKQYYNPYKKSNFKKRKRGTSPNPRPKRNGNNRRITG